MMIDFIKALLACTSFIVAYLALASGIVMFVGKTKDNINIGTRIIGGSFLLGLSVLFGWIGAMFL